jgi:RNA polymerase sigma-70 factor (ECF subfamily)
MSKSKMRDIIKKDKKNSFDDIFTWLFAELCHFSFTFIHDFNQCEDIVQEVFVKYWNIHENFNSEKASKAWLYKTVKNECIDFLRSNKNTNQLRIEILELISNETPPDFSEEELQYIKNQYSMALEELSEQTAKIFVMNREEFKSYKEIAKELGISIKSVEYHISRALLTMRKHLKDYMAILIVIWNY